MSKLDDAIKDGISNHSGEFINPWLVKGSFTHEQLAVVLDGITQSERLKKNVKTLILDLFKEADYEPYKFVEKVENL